MMKARARFLQFQRHAKAFQNRQFFIIAYTGDLQTRARGPNPAREVISTGPRRHFANKEKIIFL